jgi:tRNA(fMet)-specific endonuclease VapC
MKAGDRFLLDTSVLVRVLRGVESLADRLDADAEASVPIIALGELYYGAMKSERRDENLARIDLLAAQMTVLACDRATALHFAELKDALRRVGTPIPENDVWIAAIARQHGLTLATRDHHFENVADLAIDYWDT